MNTTIQDIRWPLERVLFALAGTITLLSVVLAVTVSKWFALLAAFVAIYQDQAPERAKAPQTELTV